MTLVHTTDQTRQESASITDHSGESICLGEWGSGVHSGQTKCGQGNRTMWHKLSYPGPSLGDRGAVLREDGLDKYSQTWPFSSNLSPSSQGEGSRTDVHTLRSRQSAQRRITSSAVLVLCLLKCDLAALLAQPEYSQCSCLLFPLQPSPQVLWLKTTQIYPLMVLEARNPRSESLG